MHILLSKGQAELLSKSRKKFLATTYKLLFSPPYIAHNSFRFVLVVAKSSCEDSVFKAIVSSYLHSPKIIIKAAQPLKAQWPQTCYIF